MEPLKIAKGKDTPEIIMDKTGGIFSVTGRSLCEDPYTFYMPVLQWVDNYVKDPNEVTSIEFRFEFLNSFTTRILANMLGKFEIPLTRAKKVEVVWYYKPFDNDILYAGQRFAEIMAMPFRFEVY